MTSGARDAPSLPAPISQATTRPAPKSHASTLAMAATAHATPAQKPRRGVSQIPSKVSAIAIGSGSPAASLKIAGGDRAANAPATTATPSPQ